MLRSGSRRVAVAWWETDGEKDATRLEVSQRVSEKRAKPSRELGADGRKLRASIANSRAPFGKHF